MKEDKIAACFKKKLSGHECDVPEMLWDKVEAELPPVRGFKTRRYRYICLAAAAVAILIVGVSSFWLIWRAPSPLQDTAAIAVVTEKYETEVSPEQRNVPEAGSRVSVQPGVTASRVYAEAVQSATEISRNEVKEPARVVDQPVCSTTHAVSVVDKPVKVVLPEMETDDVSQYDPQALAVIMHSAGKPALPSHWLSVKANAMRADVAPVQYVMRAGAQEIIYHHKMPLSVTASFEKRFGRWGVGTGVSYTFMTSDYEMADNERLGTQTLHYLGIPLYVSFNIAKVKRFSFYASAGGEADFNIAGRQKESIESLAYETIKEKKVCDKKPQLSVQARVGAAFELMSHLDLYIEPTLGYYFHHESSVHSIWNDRPWNVSLSLGLRTGF